MNTFTGNWTCSICGKAITELPFEPRSTTGLKCRDCHAKGRNEGGAQQQQSGGGDRPKFEGDWKCSNCGTEITSLPFAPRDTSNLLCINCYKQKKGG
jgi:CxxC-x17-CxxC domain-containing protein